MAEKMAVGPLDKRRLTKRCQSCAALRIKCEGGFPCKHCVKTKRTCLPSKQTTATVIFVDGYDSGKSKRHGAMICHSKPPMVTPSSSVQADPTFRFIDSFLLFIQQNQFTASFQINDILHLIRASPILYHSAVAIGALDASRRGSVSTVYGRESPQCTAFNSYRTSIRALQASFADKDAAQRDDVLWGTFFLGLFELLSDASGDGWVKHMLYGTSMMLQLSGPDKNMSSLRRTFYGMFRMLEASRALLYNDGTMLSQDSWIDFHQGLVSEDGIWDPIEEMLALMIRCSTFSLRILTIISQVPEVQRYTEPSVSELGLEGLEIQDAIYAWHNEAERRLSKPSDHDSQFFLALIYYHALLIFLSGNFDYFGYWNIMAAPILPQSEVEEHVSAILELTDEALRTSNLAGTLMFFPLRVAGSRARKEEQRSKIVKMLNSVFWKGFVVAGRMKDDLQQVWVERPL